jgi:hypothetical protein
LDEVDLVSGRFELADGLVIIQQADVDRREVALAQHASNFLPFEGARTHDRSPKQLPAKG